jgi:ABC-type spermidine/putrescine transport system permease subunit II
VQRGRLRRWRTDRGAARVPERARLGGWRAPATALLVVLYGLSVAFPVVVLTVLVLRGRPELDAAEWLTAIGSTALASGVGAVIALALAVPVGVLAARHRDRAARGIESTAYLGHALPGVTVGLSLVYLGINLAPGLYQTLAMLGFAYAVLFLSNAIGSVRSAVAQVPPSLEEASRTLGVGPLSTFRRVTLPLVSPGVAVGGLLVLLAAMKDANVATICPVAVPHPRREVVATGSSRNIYVWEPEDQDDQTEAERVAAGADRARAAIPRMLDLDVGAEKKKRGKGRDDDDDDDGPGFGGGKKKAAKPLPEQPER